VTPSFGKPVLREVAGPDTDGTAGAVLEIPADLISFRSGRRKLSPAQAQAAAANLARGYDFFSLTWTGVELTVPPVGV